MIPSLNGIEISVKGATSVLLGVKGLTGLFLSRQKMVDIHAMIYLII